MDPNAHLDLQSFVAKDLLLLAKDRIGERRTERLGRDELFMLEGVRVVE